MSLPQQSVSQSIAPTSMRAQPQFPNFSNLPLHLQRQIWEFSLNLLVPRTGRRLSNASENYSLVSGVSIYNEDKKPDPLINSRGRFDVFIRRSLHNAMRHDGRLNHINLGVLLYTCHMSCEVGLTFWKQQVESHTPPRGDEDSDDRGKYPHLDRIPDWNEDHFLAQKWKLLEVLEELLMLGRGQIPRTGTGRTVFPPVRDLPCGFVADFDRKPSRNDEHWAAP